MKSIWKAKQYLIVLRVLHNVITCKTANAKSDLSRNRGYANTESEGSNNIPIPKFLNCLPMEHDCLSVGILCRVSDSSTVFIKFLYYNGK